jgi:tetratricopeptide (TPR) repeat protein
MTTIDPGDGNQVLEWIREASRVARAGEVDAALTLLRAALPAIDHLPAAARARALVDSGQVAFRVGALEDAEVALRRALEIPRADVADDVLLSALLALGVVYHATDRFAEGAVRLEEAARLAAAAGAVPMRALALRKFGDCLIALEDFEKASSALSHALALAVELEELDDQIDVLGRLGYCHMRLGHPDIARRWYEQCLRLAEIKGHAPTIGVTMLELGRSLAQLGADRQALELFRRGRALLAGCEGAGRAVAHADAFIVKAAASIGDALAAFVSQSIAERLRIAGDSSQPPRPAVEEWLGDLAEDVWCGLLSLADERPEIVPLLSGVTFRERPTIGASDLLATVGAVTRTTYDAHSPDPKDVFEAARYIAQIRRGARASRLLARIREGALDVDISGTGNGSYLLYLRSFMAAPRLPRYNVEPWGEVDLEDLMASKLDLGPWPLIALGNPQAQAFGAGKIQTYDDTWQRDLTALGQHADLVVVAPCATGGTCWEIEWIVVQKFLKKTVFVMPPSAGDGLQWWSENWAALQRWSRYLGLGFPDYSAEGLFFALGPEGQAATKDYASVLQGSPLWETLLTEVLGQFLNSSEWFLQVRDVMPYVLRRREAERREVDEATVIQEDVESHVARITQRISSLGPYLQKTVSPYMLGLLEKGLPPQGEFAQWPPAPGRIPSAPGVCTIWEGPSHLVFVEAASDLFAALELHAQGQVDGNSFGAAVFAQEILPGLSEDLRADVDKGALPPDKMVRFRVRRNFRYRVLPMALAEARLYEAAIRGGALDAGLPRLGA